MPTPTYKIIETLHMIEGEKADAVQVAEHETIATGLTWADAKKRIRGTNLQAVREVDAAPLTVE